tara:strand:+ start:974 stop:1180 length:207 start_codon:yes stop_codon:yes gene_type:complete
MKKLHDTTIAHVARILQVALLTGTDIIDHLRMIELEEKDGFIHLNEEYEKNHNLSIEKMLEQSYKEEE